MNKIWLELIRDFREWQKDWDLYTKLKTNKPKTLDEFINHLKTKYNLTEK